MFWFSISTVEIFEKNEGFGWAETLWVPEISSIQDSLWLTLQLGPISLYGDVVIYADIVIYADLKSAKYPPREILKNKNLWKLIWQGSRRLIECAQWPQARQLSKVDAGRFQFIIITNHVVAPPNLVKSVTSPYMEIWYFSRHQMSWRDSIIEI